MELPKTEVELQIAATEIMKAFITDVEKSSGMSVPENIPFFTIRDVKAACVWSARKAIRQYCPHLENTGEQDLAGQFDEANDQLI